MWHRFLPARRGGGRPPAWRCGAMARSRRWSGQAPLVFSAGCALAVLALTQLVSLNNRVVLAREEIKRLRDEKIYLEASLGQLALEWNRASSRDTITIRAQKELDLILPEGPGMVVVMQQARPERTAPLLGQGGVAAAIAAPAQEDRP